ncbi:hypothetical protein FNW02_21335 [Komarekiella sp. 'clone 1']|uniref:Uncharacterized protein n=1 Tax=Komarekiella delphini-convector SJRDD-AB1 TaxID=2593771 RepID=A0AA40VSM0_9NOST|nr:hypothetical protein [Komarekiella delphini-convector]MBD6618297.1 hypothetical protein [Komarekiella delphini-convector SJRDD-AB1]
MKSIIKLFPLINDALKYPKRVVFTLALTSLLSLGLVSTGNNSAEAAPGAEQIQLLSQGSQNRSNRLPRAVARAVLRDASKRSGEAIANLKITQFKSQTFGNPCIFNFGEMCTREYNPIKGWQVIVRVQQQSWTYHVNQSGSQIVLDPKVSVSGATQLPKAIADTILGDTSKRSGVEIADLKITQATPKTFGNPCEFNFGEICTREFNPVEGWEVIVQVKEQSWTYHVNKSGSQIVLDPKVSAIK